VLQLLSVRGVTKLREIVTLQRGVTKLVINWAILKLKTLVTGCYKKWYKTCVTVTVGGYIITPLVLQGVTKKML